ncbi:hypothetical protein [Peribacillus sp. R9-11]|uniref:hypothetical protein n=1 Tax=Peribacillus sp. R9-11 TaxID=3073271 RepID=UPI00286842E3|nr:hypothetical protein [Peribacillus sp. R9-11]WMX56091.1 hypothetical protein RE409_02215 [Peribacillus sp. R9-11]
MKVLLENRKAAEGMWLTPIFFLLGAAVIGNYFLKEESRVQPFKVAIVKMILRLKQSWSSNSLQIVHI